MRADEDKKGSKRAKERKMSMASIIKDKDISIKGKREWRRLKRVKRNIKDNKVGQGKKMQNLSLLCFV